MTWDDTALLSKPGRRAPVALLTRAIVWVCISIAFLAVNAIRIVTYHGQGRAVGWWVYLQAAIWLVALVLWTYTGWKQIESRRAERKVG